MSSPGPMIASTFWKKTMPLCTGCDQSTAVSSLWWSAKLPAVWKNFLGRIGASSFTSAYARRSPVSRTSPPRSKYSRVEGTSSSMTVPSSSSRRPTRPPSKVMSFMGVLFSIGGGRLGADHVEAAVGQHVAAGQVRRLVGREPEARAGDELRRGDDAHRRLREQHLAAAVLPVLAVEEALGLHESRRKSVDAHRGRE